MLNKKAIRGRILDLFVFKKGEIYVNQSQMKLLQISLLDLMKNLDASLFNEIIFKLFLWSHG